MGRKPIVLTNKPSFFKVMFRDFSNRLRIPPLFVKLFGTVLPQKLLLKVRGHIQGSQHVIAEMDGHDLYFGKGWREFVRNYSLELGDLVLFHYAGNSTFYATLFGKDGCEKDQVDTRNRVEVAHADCNSKSDETGMSTPDAKFRSKEFQCPEVEATQPVNEERADTMATQGTQRPSCSMAPAAIGKNVRAPEAASKSISKRPSCQVTMKQSYVNRGSVTLPTRFVRKSFEEVGKMKATLLSSNRSWPVKLFVYSNGSGRLSGGWLRFARHHNLREGDVCIFELIEKNNFAMKVSFSRSTK